MIRKKVFFIIACLMAVIVPGRAQHTSTIDAVTVYFHQAKVTHTANVRVEAGENNITIDEITHQVQNNSIQASVKGGATLMSVSFGVNHLQEKKHSERIASIKDSLQKAKQNLDWLNRQSGVYEGQLKILNDNIRIGGSESGTDIIDLEDFTLMYGEKAMSLQKRLYQVSMEQEKIKEDIAKFEAALRQLSSSQKSDLQGQMSFKIHAEKPGNVNITFSYLTQAASWRPVYDLRAEELDQPVQLVLKGQVNQQTGYDWEDVQLTLSTGNPSANQVFPKLTTNYVNFIAPPPSLKMKHSAEPAYYESEVNRSQQSRGWGEEDVDKKLEVESTSTAVTQEYKVKAAYSVPSDAQEHLATLMTFEVPADYRYYAVPRKEQTAFLVAEITDWEKYNLLPGDANIFFEGAYVGETVLNPEQADDTLLVSMGRDEQVKVAYERLNEKSSRSFIGMNQKKTVTYQIKVRNTKRTSISIVIQDQVPVSKDDRIEVSLTQEEALKDKERGFMEWERQLSSGENTEITFGYELKYPKNKKINSGY